MEWSKIPPIATADCGFRLIRVPPYSPLHAIILSDDLIGTYTHYLKGRTHPCPRTKCTACEEGHPYRWHAYLALHTLPNKERIILELTALASEVLRDARPRFGTLRGLEILASRPSKRPNGRIHIHGKASGIPVNELPDEPDVIRIMMHIWGLDSETAQDNGRMKGARHIVRRPEDTPVVMFTPPANPK